MNVASYRHLPIRARVLAGSLLLGVMGVAATASAALAAPSWTARPALPAPGAPASSIVSWSVEPASAKAADSRNLFSYQNIKPGTSILDHVAVFNRSKQAVAFSIYATDATGTVANGALTLLPVNKRSYYIGAWTTLPGRVKQLSVIIPGGKGVIEPFIITVPLRATPGDHIGGMIAAVGVPHKNPNGQMVTLYQRIAVPIELRVTGKLVAALTVKQISTGFSNPFNPFGGGPAHVTYSVANTGNVMLSGTQVVTFTGPFGAKSMIKMHALPVVLPGDSVQYTATAGGIYPAGSIHATVTVTPKWPADATPLPVTLVAATGSGSTFAMPWALLVLVVLLGGGVYAWLRIVRGRRRAHEAEVIAAADRARRETERRLLGNAPKPAAKPAATSTPPATSAPNGRTTVTPRPNGRTTVTPRANGRPAAQVTPNPEAKPDPEPTPAAVATPEPRPAAEATTPEPSPAAEGTPEPRPAAAATPEPTPAAEATTPEPSPAAEVSAQPE